MDDPEWLLEEIWRESEGGIDIGKVHPYRDPIYIRLTKLLYLSSTSRANYPKRIVRMHPSPVLDISYPRHEVIHWYEEYDDKESYKKLEEVSRVGPDG